MKKVWGGFRPWLTLFGSYTVYNNQIHTVYVHHSEEICLSKSWTNMFPELKRPEPEAPPPSSSLPGACNPLLRSDKRVCIHNEALVTCQLPRTITQVGVIA